MSTCQTILDDRPPEYYPKGYVAVDVSKPTLTRNAAAADAAEPSTAKHTNTKQRKT